MLGSPANVAHLERSIVQARAAKVGARKPVDDVNERSECNGTELARNAMLPQRDQTFAPAGREHRPLQC